MPDQLPNALKKQRYHQMKAITDRSAVAYRAAMVGTVQRVLWEKPDDDGTASGLTDTYLRVKCDDPRAERNTFNRVRLIRSEGESFRGELIA